MGNKPHAYVAWSGGLDSTYLMHDLVERGYRVTSGYVNLVNNREKTERELRAIEKLLETDFIKGLGINHLGEVARFETLNYTGALSLSQPLAWLTGMIYSLPYRTDEIALGYVMNDDAVSFKREIKRAYRGMTALFNDPPPKLTFPLMKKSKTELWARLPVDIQNVIVWCESTERDRCGECASCRRMAHHQLWTDWTTKKEIDEINPLPVSGVKEHAI